MAAIDPNGAAYANAGHALDLAYAAMIRLMGPPCFMVRGHKLRSAGVHPPGTMGAVLISVFRWRAADSAGRTTR